MDRLVRDAWKGLLDGFRAVDAEISIVLPMQQSTAGGSGAFLVRADDNKRYWVKVLNNRQGPMVPVAEQIVGRAGALIGAATCQVRTIRIPPEILPWDYRPGQPLEAGIGHASLAVENALEVKQLNNRTDDDNRRRHASIFAVYDWCWGGDPQWLTQPDQDMKYHSHDHGWYFPPTGHFFTVEALEAQVAQPNELAGSATGIDVNEVLRLAEGLTAVTREGLASILRLVPQEWPITNDLLEAVGCFLEIRAPAVAERLTRRFGGA